MTVLGPRCGGDFTPRNRHIGIGDLDRICDDFGARQEAHLVDQVLLIERRLDGAARNTERDGAAVDAARIGERGLDHAVRRGPQLPQPLLDRGRIGCRLRGPLLPGELVADHQNSALLARDRLRGAAARRVLALRAHLGEPHAGRLIVDRRGVAALPKQAARRAPGLPEARHLAAAQY
jgi:hypothetical protein